LKKPMYDRLMYESCGLTVVRHLFGGEEEIKIVENV